MTKNMPRVNTCEATECAYNTNNMCHAMAITVGDDEPMCDTFVKGAKKGGVMDVVGGVGACKVTTCRHNDSLECSASEIRVGHNEDHVVCFTYSR